MLSNYCEMKRIILASISPGEPDIQLALYYLKVFLNQQSQKAENFSIEIQTFSAAETTDDISKKLLSPAADFIGFSCYEWNIIKILTISKNLKKNRSRIKIILGGPEVSPRFREILQSQSSIDIIVIGEGEQTFLELMESSLEDGQQLENIKGIAYRKNEKIHYTGKREEINPLDEIPSPYLAGVIPRELIHKMDYVPMETLRGCPFRCSYCYYGKEFQQVRYFSLRRIEAELKYLLAMRPAGIYFMDPTFNLNRPRAIKVLTIFKKHNICSRLHVELKAELLTKRTIEILSEAKADFIEIGIQSINKHTLAAIRRDFNPAAFARHIKSLNLKKIPYQIQLIDSLPLETFKSLEVAVNWLMHLKPFSIKIMRLRILPGTMLRAQAKLFGIRFQRHPPYYAIRSATFNETDLAKTDQLRLAIDVLYHQGMLRETIYRINKMTSLSFSNIFERWLTWMRGRHSQWLSVLMGEDQKLMSADKNHMIFKYILKHTAEDIPEFVATLCGQKQFKQDKRLKKSLHSDLERYLKQINIRST